MASADLRAELDCSICLTTYTDPVMLRCGHNYCRLCIDRVLDTREESGIYFCPECREEFQERPALMRNFALRNIMESLLLTQPTQTEVVAGIFCTYCVDSPVAAVKSCLHCEASLCEKHLKSHSKSAEHVLCEPSTSLENRKCSVHKKLLEYYCTDDASFLCVSCSLFGEHNGHKMESLDEASSKKKKQLSNVLQKLITKREKTEERVQSLEERKSKAQEKATGKVKRVTDLCGDIRKRLDDLEKKALSEISQQEKTESLGKSALIQKLEIKKEELSRKMRHIEELCNLTDPLTVLRQPNSSDLGDLEEEGVEDDIGGHHGGEGDTGGHDGDGLDVAVFSDMLDTLYDIITDIRSGIYEKGLADILLDANTAGQYLYVLEDLKSATCFEKQMNRPETAERFQYGQVISRGGFSSGRHYWDVESSKKESFRVGMCYHSIDRKGPESQIGRNAKSWCLWRYINGLFAVHNSVVLDIPGDSSSDRFRICLDYEAGRLSFYQLCDPIRHLYTFTATFTEPLHAALWLWGGSMKISRGNPHHIKNGLSPLGRKHTAVVPPGISRPRSRAAIPKKNRHAR